MSQSSAVHRRAHVCTDICIYTYTEKYIWRHAHVYLQYCRKRGKPHSHGKPEFQLWQCSTSWFAYNVCPLLNGGRKIQQLKLSEPLDSLAQDMEIAES